MTEPLEVNPPRPGSHGDTWGEPDAVPWVTIAEAAAAVGVSPSTIRRAAKAGKIRGHRDGEWRNSRWLVHLGDTKARWGILTAAPRRKRPIRLSQLREHLVVNEPERRWWQRSR